ncbi:hypothetical protein, partial [Achromobacter xylosoxidans]|uniref:hypothetical protein n=1 Tax=Alcaligenes xylosoxydans xylosoxydans TaxID=85698 RepID=UPI001F116D91
LEGQLLGGHGRKAAPSNALQKWRVIAERVNPLRNYPSHDRVIPPYDLHRKGACGTNMRQILRTATF